MVTERLPVIGLPNNWIFFMIKRNVFIILILALFYGVNFGKQILEKPRPLTDVIDVRAKPVKYSNKVSVPLITWGGDVATIYAESTGIFRDNGLPVSLFVENVFTKQVKKCLLGNTPYLRGTMGMINAASEVFKKNGLKLVIIYQLTWSTGGDALVVRKSIKKPKHLKNKTIALQLYGPHMDYLANILQNSGVSLNRVKMKWFSELTIPQNESRGRIIDPVTAFLNDKSIDGVMAIIPDALNLTSGGRIGTGAAGSVKGAKILLSTKTASRVISDVYAVRSDYFMKNKTKVKQFVKSLLKGQLELKKHLRAKNKSQTFKKVLVRAADMLFGTRQAVADVEGLLGDCTFVGAGGNSMFFSGRGTTRSMRRLTKEIQRGFISLGLMRHSVKLDSAGLNYSELSGGIRLDNNSKTKKFDIKKISQKISVEPTSWADEGTLFQIEINFSPNQSVFSEKKYARDFKKALDIAQTYEGALVMIEGHSDPLGILKAKRKHRPSIEISQMQQQAKNLSLKRARAVRKSFFKYCKRAGMRVDESQFVAVGMGITNPKYSPPRTRAEWNANRRVVFRIKQVEAELNDFKPLD